VLPTQATLTDNHGMSTARSDAQRATSRRNGAMSRGPRSEDGKMRSSANRVTHALNSVRLLLPTEDIAEYKDHTSDWISSLAPTSLAEHQIVMLVADLMWRLKRVERIEQRRALALLEDLLEKTQEWKVRAQVNDLITVLVTLAHIITTTTLPVSTAGLGGLLGGISGLEQMLDDLRGLLPVEMWPDDAVCSFLLAKKVLTETADREEMVDQVFTKLGDAAADLGAVFRSLGPVLDANVEKSRIMLSTMTLLHDDEDRRFERHRRILENSVARQLDLLVKVREMAKTSAVSGSSERLPPVELRILKG
jgi:hypothetical protein